MNRRRADPGRPYRAALAVVMTLLAGCSTARPWINEPLQPGAAVAYDGRRPFSDPSRAGDLLVVASFSGGGSRAAAFAHAALSELEAHPFDWEGTRTSLAREIDMVTGVSGGSVAAAHFALHGLEAHLARFPEDFLEVDFQGQLVDAVLSPAGLQRLSSPWQGRGHLLADAFDAQLFAGATFGNLTELPGRAYLIVGATDLVNGSEFDFASDQFTSLCSSIDDVPLAFAVAASSAVPLLFSPLTLQNHSGSCPEPGGPAAADKPGVVTARARLVQSEAESLGRSERKYVHLVDGGVSDNLGLRRIADYVVQAGGIRAVLESLGVGSPGGVQMPRRIVFLSVNSETRGAPEFESSSRVPGTLDVLGALINGNLGRHSRETALVFDDAIEQWRADLRRDDGDVDIFRIEVNLHGLEDAALRDRVLAIPTAFRISAEDRKLLRVAARAALDESVELQRFQQSVAGQVDMVGSP